MRMPKSMLQILKKWYDGYHFGDFDVYCPWDVMNYILDLQHHPQAKPASYWKNTSDNAIYSFILLIMPEMLLRENLETLLFRRVYCFSVFDESFDV